jgi:hypothetical protein
MERIPGPQNLSEEYSWKAFFHKYGKKTLFQNKSNLTFSVHVVRESEGNIKMSGDFNKPFSSFTSLQNTPLLDHRLQQLILNLFRDSLGPDVFD